jgi:hypothetical protein
VRLKRIMFKRVPGSDAAIEKHFNEVLEKYEAPYRCIELANRWAKRMQQYLKEGRKMEFVASRALQSALFDESGVEISEAEEILIKFWVHGAEFEAYRKGRTKWNKITAKPENGDASQE